MCQIFSDELYYAARDARQKRKARGEYLAAARLAPEADWTGEALFLAGNTWWNLDRNVPEAVELWNEVIEKHPKHAEAPRSAYYIGIAYEQQKRYDEARRAFERLKETFAESAFIKLADDHLKEIARKSR